MAEKILFVVRCGDLKYSELGFGTRFVVVADRDERYVLNVFEHDQLSDAVLLDQFDQSNGGSDGFNSKPQPITINDHRKEIDCYTMATPGG